MSNEKRKRKDEGADIPRKKTSVKPPTGNVKVEFVNSSNALGPILATTPGFSYPTNITFKPYKYTKILPSATTTELLLQSSEHPRLDYTAQQEKDGSSEGLLKDYVGVFDPATQKLKLVEVPRLTVRSTLRSEMDELREETAKTAQTMASKRFALTSEFGSKKSKKAIEAITQNAISRGRGSDPNAPAPNSSVSDAVMKGMSAAAASMPSRAEMEATLDSFKPRPRADLTAEYPSDVYPVDTLIGKELMGLIPIKDWLDSAQGGTGVEVASKFVARRILKLAKNNEVQKLKVLKFILLCINFNAALKTKGRGAKQIPFKGKLAEALGNDVPSAVASGIHRKFASQNNDMTRWHIDNLMTHVAAAALIVDGFRVDVNDLRDDLKLENKEIKQYFQEIGCRITLPTEADKKVLGITKAEAVNHNVATLKIPLVFPKVKMGRKGGGR